MGNQTSRRIPTQPPRPETTTTLLREKAQGCTECKLVFPRNISVASVTAQMTKDKSEFVLGLSLPFTFEANGNPVSSNTMRLFHPCPFKVNNIQYDAVLVLDSKDVALVLPIQGSSMAGGQGVFFSNLVPRLNALTTPDIPAITIPTGSTWSLTTLIPLNDQGNPLSGYFSWKGVSDLDLKEAGGFLAWEPTGPVKRFICMETPALMSSMDLQVVTSMLIPRSVENALPKIPTSYMYVPPCSAKRDVPFREYFEAGCDPLQPGKTPAIVKDFFWAVPWFAMVIAAIILIHFWIRYFQGPFVLLVTRIGQALGSGLRTVFEGQKIQQSIQTPATATA